MVQFDLGSLLQGHMRIAKVKSAYNSLIIGPRHLGTVLIIRLLLVLDIWDGKPTYRKSPWPPPSRSNEDSQS